MTSATRVFLCAVLVPFIGLQMRFAEAQAPAAQGITRLLITTYRLEPDSVQRWTALQKDEVVPALKKAGVKSRDVYRTIVGEATE